MDSREGVKNLRERYPKGTRIRLIKMGDDPNPVNPGSLGTVDNVDDAGTIHVNWDDGRTLGLIPGIDEFSLVYKYHMEIVFSLSLAEKSLKDIFETMGEPFPYLEDCLDMTMKMDMEEIPTKQQQEEIIRIAEEKYKEVEFDDYIVVGVKFKKINAYRL